MNRRGRIPGSAARVVLLCVITAMPWAFGGVEPRAALCGYVGVLVALVCWLRTLLYEKAERSFFPSAAVPLVSAVALGLLQLVPLPHALHSLLGPESVRLRRFLAGREIQAATDSLPASAEISTVTVSWYPASTRHDLAFLVQAAIVFLLGARLFRRRRTHVWLFGLLAVNGAALAYFGIVQQFRPEGMLYWLVPLSEGGNPFGPFVNKNNAAGFLNLCLAGALGATVWAFSRKASMRRRDAFEVNERNASLTARLGHHLRQVVGQLDAVQLCLLALTAFVVAGVLATLSRGAFLAMVGAGGITLISALVTQRRTGFTWLLGAVAVGGLALVGSLGLTDSLQEQLATLLDPHALPQEGRLEHWEDGLLAARDFWTTGTGLGTYRFVYPLYQRRFDPRWFYHAENQYLEAMVEGGVLALALMVATIVLVAVAAWRLARRPSEQTLALVGVFALSSQLIHACFDFGLYLPANTLLLALLCGSVCGRAGVLQQSEHAPPPPVANRLLLGPLAALSMLVMGVWGLIEVSRLPVAEAARRAVALWESPPDEDGPSLQQLHDLLQTAVARAGDDAESHWRLGELYLRLFRIHENERMRGEFPSVAEPTLWNLTDTVQLHARAHQLHRSDAPEGLQRLRNDPAVRRYLWPAFQHFNAARRGCSLLPWVHVRLAELSFLTEDAPAEVTHLARVRRLAPSDPSIHFRCALLDLYAGRGAQAFESFRRSLELTPRYEDAVVQITSDRLAVAEMIEKVLPPLPKRLVRLAATRYTSQEHARRLLLQRAAAVMDEADLPPDQKHYLWATIHVMRQEWDAAIASYRDALELRPHQFQWRYELARVLFQQGALPEAHQEASRCQRQQPENPAIRRLMRDINQSRLR